MILTVFSTTGIILFASMAVYKMARTKTRYSIILLTFCIAPMMVPFQAIMITLTKFATFLHLTNSLQGLIVLYWGFGVPLVTFLYHGFVKTVPIDLDESAAIDGCSSFRTFFTIIFPLLKPVTGLSSNSSGNVDIERFLIALTDYK